ncbi:MAG: hypothetical protein ACE5LU_19650 [Anaerolineae bacterium]
MPGNRRGDRAQYAAFLLQREAHLLDEKQKTALEEIGEEIDNVRVAWDWAVEQGELEIIGKSLGILHHFYYLRCGHRIRGLYRGPTTAPRKPGDAPRNRRS